jgi:hypothetical protein
MTPLEANRMRWRGAPGHYEVWYATLSHLASRTGFWIRYTLEAPLSGPPYAQLWFARFDGDRPEATFGINQKLPISAFAHQAAPFDLRLGSARFTASETSAVLSGALEGDGHRAEWQLSFRPATEVHRHLPSIAYHAGWAETVVLSPSARALAHGQVTVDGKRYAFDGEPLGQTHLWGRKHAYAWAWSHCTAFVEDPGATLETLTVRIKRGPLVLPPLTMLSLQLGSGEQIVVREPWQLPRARSSYGTGRYALEGSSGDRRVEIELSCRPEDMLMAEYADPDGEAAWCHNTECADARVRLFRRARRGWEETQVLESHRGAHYEWAARAGDPLVKKRHVLVA